MRESLLHFLWEQQRLPFFGLKLVSGEELQVWDPGELNRNAGPDFLNARIAIGETLWAGHVEIHPKSSDWDTHGHKTDPNYQNVILHVVWDDDKPILGFHGIALPTLQLKDYIAHETLVLALNYQSRLKDYLINCQKDHHRVPDPIKEEWWLTLSRQRLLSKSDEIRSWLIASNNNWEQVMFISLIKGFGLYVNGEAFLSLGQKLDYGIVQKLRHDQQQLEGLFLGMSGLLDTIKNTDPYSNEMRTIFEYQCTKFSLDRSGVLRPDFLRLRPSNFPTIRLSQLAVLMASQPRLFGKLIVAYQRLPIHRLLDVSASAYWETHYTFGKPSQRKPKRISAAFRDLLIINSIVPVQLAYALAMGKDIWSQIRSLLESCPPEKNRILVDLSQLGMKACNALKSQALLRQYQYHCIKNRCLECAVGQYLLKGI